MDCDGRVCASLAHTLVSDELVLSPPLGEEAGELGGQLATSIELQVSALEEMQHKWD